MKNCRLFSIGLLALSLGLTSCNSGKNNNHNSDQAGKGPESVVTTGQNENSKVSSQASCPFCDSGDGESKSAIHEPTKEMNVKILNLVADRSGTESTPGSQLVTSSNEMTMSSFKELGDELVVIVNREAVASGEGLFELGRFLDKNCIYLVDGNLFDKVNVDSEKNEEHKVDYKVATANEVFAAQMAIEAKKKVHRDQVPYVDELENKLKTKKIARVKFRQARENFQGNGNAMNGLKLKKDQIKALKENVDCLNQDFSTVKEILESDIQNYLGQKTFKKVSKKIDFEKIYNYIKAYQEMKHWESQK